MKMETLFHNYAYAMIGWSLQIEEVNLNGIKTSEILFSGLRFLMTDL